NARYRRAARVGNPDAPAGQRHRTRLATTRDALDDATCGRVDAKETARVVVRNPERRALERHPLRACSDRDRLQNASGGGVEPPDALVEVAGDPDRAARGQHVISVVADSNGQLRLPRGRIELVDDPALARDPDAGRGRVKALV